MKAWHSLTNWSNNEVMLLYSSIWVGFKTLSGVIHFNKGKAFFTMNSLPAVF